MSTLKTNACQLGQSATANQNFTLYQPSVPDGTVRLGVGNSGATTSDVITMTNTGVMTVPTINASTALQSGGIAAERIVQGTAQATTSGTAVGFTGIPSWVKRITLQLRGCANNGGSGWAVIQIGSGSYTTSGYTTNQLLWTSSSGAFYTSQSPTTGVPYTGSSACTGDIVFTTAGSNVWYASGSTVLTIYSGFTTGSVTLSGALDRIQIIGSGGGSFTAGSVNIIYEG